MGCFTGQPSWKDNRTSNMATDNNNNNNNNNSSNNNKRDSLNSGGRDDTRRTSEFRLLPKNLLGRLKRLGGGDHSQTLNKITTFGSRAGDGSSQPLTLYHT